jgi:hypothetical protein
MVRVTRPLLSFFSAIAGLRIVTEFLTISTAAEAAGVGAFKFGGYRRDGLRFVIGLGHLDFIEPDALVGSGYLLDRLLDS